MLVIMLLFASLLISTPCFPGNTLYHNTQTALPTSYWAHLDSSRRRWKTEAGRLRDLGYFLLTWTQAIFLIVMRSPFLTFFVLGSSSFCSYCSSPSIGSNSNVVVFVSGFWKLHFFLLASNSWGNSSFSGWCC